MNVIFSYSSTSSKILNLYKKFLKNLFLILKKKIKIISQPTLRKIKTFLKSPHVNKRAKENFELKFFKFKLHTNLTISQVKIFRYNVPKNIHLKILYNV
jgi:ribosomal protein S10